MDKKKAFDIFSNVFKFDRPSLIGIAEPSIDVFETETEVIVTAQLPGVKKEDVHLKVTDNSVTLRVEKKEHREKEHHEGEKYEHYQSVSSSSWNRYLTLPSIVVPDKAQAQFKNGVLEVRVPKNKAKQGRDVRIR
ncbi:MAG TPA: Hsp20/alpha crystallin family protein [Candidatus Norongarragalinales archaeon]|jgi:HSP20 family protein|nr:Hsp20/alpha crystallin family protein [Candidatus Norongarragalinales archaeon]